MPAGDLPAHELLLPGPRWRLTFGDNHLYCLRADGSLAWKRDLGIGAIPSFILANEVGLFLELPFGDGRALVFDYSSERPIGRFGYTAGEEGAAMIATPGEGRYTTRLSRMSGLAGVGASSFRLPLEARLVRVDAGNRSLWQGRKAEPSSTPCSPAAVSCCARGDSVFPDGPAGSGFWTVADERLRVYRNRFTADAMEIAVYRFPD